VVLLTGGAARARPGAAGPSGAAPTSVRRMAGGVSTAGVRTGHPGVSDVDEVLALCSTHHEGYV
jgi:hypothetical protein